MWPQKVLHTVHFNDLINQWGGILTPSRGSDEFMMLLWILWTRITVPDSRISSASGTVNPSHPTPARAGGQIYSALQLHETNSSNYLARDTKHTANQHRRTNELRFHSPQSFLAQREKTLASEAWGALWYGAAKGSCSAWGRLKERLFIRHLTSLRRFLRSTADLIRSTYRKGLLVTSTSLSSSKLLHWASLFPHI